jgi:hypothetical protein
MTTTQFNKLYNKLSDIQSQLSSLEEEVSRLKVQGGSEQWAVRAEWEGEEADDDNGPEVRWYAGTLAKGGTTYPVWTEDYGDADLFLNEAAARLTGKGLKEPTPFQDEGDWTLWVIQKTPKGFDPASKKLVHLPTKPKGR